MINNPKTDKWQMAQNFTDDWHLDQILTDNWHLHPLPPSLYPDPRTIIIDAFTDNGKTMVKADMSSVTCKSSILGSVVSFPVSNIHFDHCSLPAMQENMAWCYVIVFSFSVQIV